MMNKNNNNPDLVEEVLLNTRATSMYHALDGGDVIKQHYTINQYIRIVMSQLAQHRKPKDINNDMRKRLLTLEMRNLEKRLSKTQPRPPRQRNLRQIAEFQNKLTELAELISTHAANASTALLEFFKRALDAITAPFRDFTDFIIARLGNKLLTERLANLAHDVTLWILDFVLLGVLVFHKEHIAMAMHVLRMVMTWKLPQNGAAFVGVVALQLVKHITTHEAEFQAGNEAEEDSSYLQAFAALFYPIIQALTPERSFKDFVSGLEPYSKLSSFFNTSLTLAERVSKMLRTAFGFVYHLIFGVYYMTSDEKTQLTEIQELLPSLERAIGEHEARTAAVLHARVSALYKHVNHILEPELAVRIQTLLNESSRTAALDSNSIPTALTFAHKVAEESIRLGDPLEPVLEKFNKTANDYTDSNTCVLYISRAVSGLEKLHAAKLRESRSREIRVPSYVVGFTGEPGVGKDSIVNWALPIIGALYDPAVSVPYVYQRTANFQEYKREKSMHISDFLQIQTNPAIENDLNILWKTREATPQLHDSPSIEEKGTNYDQTEIVMVTMNGYIPVNTPVASLAAAARSFSVFYEVKLNPKFAVDGKLDFKRANDTFALPSSHVKFHLIDSIWTFVPRDPCTGISSGKSLCFSEMVSRCVFALTENAKRKQQRVDYLKQCSEKDPLLASHFLARPEKPRVFLSVESDSESADLQMHFTDFRHPMTQEQGDKLINLEPELIFDYSPAAYAIVRNALELSPEATTDEIMDAMVRFRPKEESVPQLHALLSSTSPLPFKYREVLKTQKPENLSNLYLKRTDRGFIATDSSKYDRRGDYHFDYLTGQLTLSKELFYYIRDTPILPVAVGVTIAAILGGVVYALTTLSTSLVEQQVKSEYNPMASVSAPRKRQNVKPPGVALFQNGMLADEYMKAIHQNLRVITIHTGGKSYSASATLIRGRHMLTVKHILHDFEGRTHGPQSLVTISSSGALDASFTCNFSELRISASDADVAMILLPPHYSHGKDILSRFALLADLQTQPRSNILIGRQFTGAQNSVLFQDVGDIEGLFDVDYKGPKPGVAHGVFGFTAATKRGDCGSLYITQDTHFGKGSRKIFAIHSMGVPANRIAYGVPITQEILLELISTLEDNTPSEEDSPSWVSLAEQQGTIMAYNPQGKIPKELIPRAITTTEVRPSLIQKALFSHPEIWNEPRTAPVKLHRTGDHDPYTAAFVKTRTTNNLWDSKLYESYKYAMEATISDLGLPVYSRPLTWHQTFNGLPSYGILRLPLNTSLGFRGRLFPNNKFRDRRDLFTIRDRTPSHILEWAQAPPVGDKEDIYPVEELYLELRRVEDLCSRNVNPFTIWIDQVKDERKPKEKILKGRIFSFPPIAQNLLYRKYGAPLGITMGDPARRIRNGFAYKVNPESPEWEVLYNKFPSKNFIDGDMSSFDANTPPQLNSLDKELFTRVFTTGWTQAEVNCAMISIHTHMFATRLTPNGDLYMPVQGGVSGHSLTTPLNMLHQHYNLHAFDYWVRNFRMLEVHLDFVNYGDDFICSSDNPDVNYFLLKEFLALTGQKLTPTDKGGSELAFTPLDKVSLLKRTFCSHDGHIFGALDPEVIREIPLWILKGVDTDEVATRVNAEMALRSCFTHGRTFFENFSSKLVRALQLSGVRFKIPFTYESLLREYFGLLQNVRDEPEFQSQVSFPPLKVDSLGKNLRAWVAPTPAARIATERTKSLGKGDASNQARHVNLLTITDKSTVSANRPSLMSSPTGEIPSTVSGTTTIESAGTLVHDQGHLTPLYGEINPYPAADTLTKALERTYLVSTIAWASTSASMTTLTGPAFPSSLIAFDYIKSKLQSYAYLRYEGIEITVTYSSNPYFSGTLALVPTPENIATLRNVPELLLNSGATLLTASKQETITMRIPYMGEAYLYKMGNPYDSERLRIVVLHPLTSVGGGTPTLNLSIYARFINPQLIAPDPRSSAAAELQSSIIEEAFDKATNGVITGTPEATGTLGRVMTTLSHVADAAEVLALSKPTTVQEPTLAVPSLLPSFGNVSGIDLAPRSTYTLDPFVANRGVLPNQVSDITLADLGKLPGYIARGSFTSSAVKNAIVLSNPVSPCAVNVGVTGVGQPVHLTHAALIAYSADWWRGSMKYKLIFDCSPLLTFTARISWFPTTAAATGFDFEGAGGDLVGKIVTVTGPTEIDFSVPYLPYKGVLSTWDNVNSPSDYNSNGQIIVSIIEPVSSPTSVSTVFWSLFSSTDDDFEIWRANTLPTSISYATAPAEFQTNIREAFSKPFPGLIPSKQFTEKGINLPESITHIPLSALFKRYSRAATVSAGSTVERFDVQFDPTNRDQTLMCKIISMFYFWRGGIRVKLVYEYLSNDDTRPVRRIAYFGNDAFSGDGSLNAIAPTTNPILDLAIPYFSPHLGTHVLIDEEDASPSSNYSTFIYDLAGSANLDRVAIYHAVDEDFSVAICMAPLMSTSAPPMKPVTKRTPIVHKK